MFDKNFRDRLDYYCEINEIDEEDRPLILDNSAYDNSIIGISNDNRLVYDYDKMLVEYSKDNKCTIEEAMEWIDYNTIRAINYNSNEHKPIIIYNRQFIEEI